MEDTTRYEVECYWRSADGHRNPDYNGTKLFTVTYWEYGDFYSASADKLGVGKDAKTPEGAIRSLCNDSRIRVDGIKKLD